jgi:3-hydroxyisobutyrate dehydrogenase-like beta-hydroxyacid dehydrogenase
VRRGQCPRIALLGLGEAGAAIAADLVAAGAEVSGWDPAWPSVDGVRLTGSAAEAVGDADVVLSLNAQSAAVPAAESVAEALPAGCLYADLNTASAAVKRAVADAVPVLFADIALLAPVPGNGLATPSFASGPGAERYADTMHPLGAKVEIVGSEPGDAAARKLLRSVFTKGLAAAIVESLAAARAAGCEDWLRADIAKTLRDADDDLLERLERGSIAHAKRRVDEMESASALLDELGVAPHVARASVAVLRDLASS